MPNRILKESICTSDSIDKLSWFEEVLFYRLIVNCDDFGRFDGRAAVIKNRLFPLKDDLTLGTVKAAIQKLVSAGLVITYESMGKPYLYLPTWTAHQTARAKKSKYPAPDGETISSAVDVKSSENICKQMKADESECSRIRIRESNSGSENDAPARNSAASAVLSAYLDKINPMASQASLEELRGYAEVMGEACCLRAFDIALDEKKAAWSYIRGILRAKMSQGVRCLADWDAEDERRERGKNPPKGPRPYHIETMDGRPVVIYDD